MSDRDAGRPDPDQLLAQVQAEAARATRARLKIFFGAAPGVGKTYTMLEAAHRAVSEGVDLVVGVVETHGRGGTAALVEGLPLLSRRRIEHRGVMLDELDLEAAIARAPAVILVDELAHTNAPGTRHVKRWQDVIELLEAGISVWTTLNVQHVESLGDVVQQITGVKVRETVPDAVLERADDVELVDLSPEDLLERLAEGKVYLPEQAARASESFFSRGNLLALRELALRRVAERVDVEVLAYRREHGIAIPWPTRDRILVCVGSGPGSERLVRATKRIAEGLRAPWSAATVEVIGAPPPADSDRIRLAEHLRLVESLGGAVVRLRGHRVPTALLEHAQAHNVTRLVVGKPTHGRWRDRLRGSLLDDLIRGSGPIELHVIAPVEQARSPRPQAQRVAARPWRYSVAVAAITAVTALGLATFGFISLADITMLYLIAIMLAALGGRGPALVAATLAVIAFDLAFVPPRFTFAVSDTQHLLTFAVMFASGLAISTLMGRLRAQERDATERERRTAALLAFTREVSSATDASEVAVVATQHLEDGLDAAAAVLLPESPAAGNDRDAGAGLVAVAGLMPLAGRESTVARWAFEHRKPAGHGTDTLPGSRVLAIPLLDGDRAVGVLAVQRRKDAGPFDADQIHLIDALARQTTLALTRVILADQAKDAALRANTEELRSSLLSSVSHDLRTPLAVITGAATSLRDDGDRLTPLARHELVSTIVDDARRLERVLGNLLQLTRVETGLQPTREWVPAEEVVGAALSRLEEAIGDQAMVVDVASDVMLWLDPVLFEQVLINLIENALKHGRPPYEIRIAREAAEVVIAVADRGPGLGAPAARLFEKFVRASSAPGAGLGLAVVRAIVVAHGGTVTATARPGGGAVFTVRIPAGTAPVVGDA